MRVKKYDSVEVGKIYSSNNYGDFLVVKMESYMKNLIRFIDTGFEKWVQLDSILMGSVKDLYKPSICNVGYIGDGVHKSSSNRVHSKEYVLWTSIIHRCYDVKYTYYYLYGGNGVTVDERWHNFQNFVEDIRELENYNKWSNKDSPYEWTIDKDKYSKNSKIYSKDTCWFTDMEQQNLLQNKYKIFGYVDGIKVYEYNNVKDISETLNIMQSSISASLNKHIGRKSAGLHDGKPIIWRYEGDFENIIYKRDYKANRNKKNYYNGFVNGELIFKNLTTNEVIEKGITKSRGGIITSIKKKGSCGKYKNEPIYWQYAEEGELN